MHIKFINTFGTSLRVNQLIYLNTSSRDYKRHVNMRSHNFYVIITTTLFDSRSIDLPHIIIEKIWNLLAYKSTILIKRSLNLMVWYNLYVRTQDQSLRWISRVFHFRTIKFPANARINTARPGPTYFYLWSSSRYDSLPFRIFAEILLQIFSLPRFRSSKINSLYRN